MTRASIRAQGWVQANSAETDSELTLCCLCTLTTQISGYPVVQDTLTQAHNLLQSHSTAQALYDRATSLSQQILARLEPLQKRLPLQTVDDYANSTLDFVEKRFPQVKSETNDLLKSARKPADDAAGIAKSYADGITSVSARIHCIVGRAKWASLGAVVTSLRCWNPALLPTRGKLTWGSLWHERDTRLFVL